MQADECTVSAGLQVFQTDTDRGTDAVPGAGGVEYPVCIKTPAHPVGCGGEKQGQELIVK